MSGTYLSTRNAPRAHRVVARSAKAYCGELYKHYYDKMPGFREAWPSENKFVRAHWHFFIAQARATLAQMLGSNIDEGLKEEIYDALIKDHSLANTPGRAFQVKLDL